MPWLKAFHSEILPTAGTTKFPMASCYRVIHCLSRSPPFVSAPTNTRKEEEWHETGVCSLQTVAASQQATHPSSGPRKRNARSWWGTEKDAITYHWKLILKALCSPSFFFPSTPFVWDQQNEKRMVLPTAWKQRKKKVERVLSYVPSSSHLSYPLNPLQYQR